MLQNSVIQIKICAEYRDVLPRPIRSRYFNSLRPRMTHLCVTKLAIIDPDNGLSPGRHQAIIWTSAGILLIRTLRTKFNKFLTKFTHFYSRKCIWKCRLRNCGTFSRHQCVKISIHKLYFAKDGIYYRDAYTKGGMTSWPRNAFRVTGPV